MSNLFVSKVADVTIVEGAASSSVLKGGETIQDGEFLLIFSPSSLDASLDYKIEIAANTNYSTSPAVDSDFSTLVDDTNADVELPPEGKCRIYNLPLWPSFRFSAFDNTGTLDQVGVNTVFKVFKAWRVNC